MCIACNAAVKIIEYYDIVHRKTKRTLLDGRSGGICEEAFQILYAAYRRA